MYYISEQKGSRNPVSQCNPNICGDLAYLHQKMKVNLKRKLSTRKYSLGNDKHIRPVVHKAKCLFDVL